VAHSRTEHEWGKGTPWDDLVKIAGKFGQNWKIESYPYTDEGFATGKASVLTQLRSGTPVMIDILDEEAVKSAHTILIVGYDAKSGEFLAHNPARHFPGFQVFPEDRLKTIWRSIGFIRGNTNLLRPTLSVERKSK
jgi:peptidase C39-like protein